MKEKKFFVIFVLAYVLLIYATWDSLPTTSLDGRTILTFWHTYNDPEERVLKSIIKDWEKLNPDYTVRPVRIPFDGHKPKIRTSLTVGQAPDMARVDWSFVCELARKNGVVNLDTLGFLDLKDDYVEAPLKTGYIDGNHYSLPDQTTCVALFYNKKLFERAGLDPIPPKTWADFVRVGKILTNKKESKYAFAMTNTLWWNLPFFNTFGAKIIAQDGKTCLLSSEEAIEAVDFLASLYRDHEIEGGGWRSGSISAEQGFINEAYAMIFMGPWKLAEFASNPNLDFGVGLIPEGPFGTSTNVGGTNVVIFKESKHIEKSYDFLTFFTNAKNQAHWCTELNQLPVNLGAYDLVKFEDENFMLFLEQMKSAKPNPIVTNYDMLGEILDPEIEAVITKQKTAKTAMDAAVKQIEKELLYY